MTGLVRATNGAGEREKRVRDVRTAEQVSMTSWREITQLSLFVVRCHDQPAFFNP